MSSLAHLRAQFTNRWRAASALTALLAVVIVAIIALSSGGDDDPETPDSVARQGAEPVESVDASDAGNAATTPSPTPSSEPTTEAQSESPTTEPTEVPTAEPTEVAPLTDCLRTTGSVESEAEQATQAVREALAAAADLRCFAEDLAELRGDVHWLALTNDSGAGGGALAIRKPDNQFDVVLLDLGPWNSYARIGGNEGRDAPAIAGLPSGRVLAERGGYSVEVSGNVYLHGESETTTFYWLTAPIFESWVVNGAESSLLGSPASSVYSYEGGDRVDFEGGFLTHTQGESVVVNSISLDRVFLPANANLRGRLISARDGTGWFIDDQARRWWVPNVQTWFCAGGDKNAIATDQPGYAIHRLTLGGVAPCPLAATGTNPIEGGVEVQRYCTEQVDRLARSVEVEGGWACDVDATSVAVIHSEICVWQYGDAASPGDEAHPFDWTCTAN